MVEQRKADMKRIVDEAYHKGNVDALGDVLATNIVLHTP